MVCSLASGDWYCIDLRSEIVIVRSRLVGTWFAVEHREIDTILIGVRQWPLYESGWSGRGLQFCVER